MKAGGDHVLGAVNAKIGASPYAISIVAGRPRLTADEPEKLGRQDAGPPPFNIPLASLGACTSITLKMHAGRKGWPLEALDSALSCIRTAQRDYIERHLALKGPLDQELRAKLADVAERLPVTAVINGGVAIHTEREEKQ